MHKTFYKLINASQISAITRCPMNRTNVFKFIHRFEIETALNNKHKMYVA